MRRTPALLAAFCLALAALLPAPASARARLDGIPAELRGGERVEIRWSDLDADVHEVELELSLAGARWVRISPEMEVLEGSFTWRVPEGLAGEARIRLRAGGGGGRGEREVAEVKFTLVDTSAPGPRSSLSTPGWWDVDSDEHAAPCGLFGRRAASLSPLAEIAEAVTVSVPLAERTSSVHRTDDRLTAAALVPHASARSFVPPRQAPLRN